jgi:hypothetical protein
MESKHGARDVRRKKKISVATLLLSIALLIGLNSCARTKYVYIHEDAQYWHEWYLQAKYQLDECVDHIEE